MKTRIKRGGDGRDTELRPPLAASRDFCPLAHGAEKRVRWEWPPLVRGRRGLTAKAQPGGGVTARKAPGDPTGKRHRESHGKAARSRLPCPAGPDERRSVSTLPAGSRTICFQPRYRAKLTRKVKYWDCGSQRKPALVIGFTGPQGSFQSSQNGLYQGAIISVGLLNHHHHFLWFMNGKLYSHDGLKPASEGCPLILPSFRSDYSPGWRQFPTALRAEGGEVCLLTCINALSWCSSGWKGAHPWGGYGHELC